MSRLELGPGLSGQHYAPHVTRWQAARSGAWLVWQTAAWRTAVWRPWRPLHVVVMHRDQHARPLMLQVPLWRWRR